MKAAPIKPGALARCSLAANAYLTHNYEAKEQPLRYTHSMRYNRKPLGRSFYAKADYPFKSDMLFRLIVAEPLYKLKGADLKFYKERVKRYNQFKRELKAVYRVRKGYLVFVTMFALFNVRMETMTRARKLVVSYEDRWLTVVTTSVNVDAFIARHDGFIGRVERNEGNSFSYESIVEVKEIAFDILIKKAPKNATQDILL